MIEPYGPKQALSSSRGERSEMNGLSEPERLTMCSLVIGAGLSVVLLLGMVLLDRALKTPAAPAGIISFELVGTFAGAQSIMDSWDEPARIQAVISLGLDFFFLLAYAYTLAGACRLVAARIAPNRLRVLGKVLAWGAWGAALLDTIENIALIQLLIGHGETWHPRLAALCAWPKFGLAGGALLYIFTGGVLMFWARRKDADI